MREWAISGETSGFALRKSPTAIKTRSFCFRWLSTCLARKAPFNCTRVLTNSVEPESTRCSGSVAATTPGAARSKQPVIKLSMINFKCFIASLSPSLLRVQPNCTFIYADLAGPGRECETVRLAGRPNDPAKRCPPGGTCRRAALA